MNGQVLTVGDFTVLVTLVVAVLGLWWRIENKVSGPAKEALVKAQFVEAELNRYKLEVANEYAKNGFIRDVENRLVERFDSIVKELHGLRTDLQQAVIEMAKGPGTGGRKPRS